jgi:peptidoglycan/LPS O-acetylase OafA/YrhL
LPEMIMLSRNRLMSLVGLCAAGVAFILGSVWIIAGAGPAPGPWAVLPLAGSAALLACTAIAIGARRNDLRRYRVQHKPLAGPRPGAQLPN